MKKEIEINEWIEAYLNGDLSAADTEQFRKRLQEDQVFAREVDMHRQLREIIEDGAYIRIRNEIKNIHSGKTMLKRNFRRIGGFGLGGLIIGIILLLVFRNTRTIRESLTTIPVSISPADTTGIFSDREGKRSSAIQVKKIARPVSGQAAEKQKESTLQNENNHQPVQEGTNKMPADSNVNKNSLSRSPQRNLSGVPEETKPPAAINNPVPLKNTDCRKIKFKVELVVQESCNNKATGSFSINRQTVSGGKPPYSFSLNTTVFYDTSQFAALFPGNYPVYVKDGNNCIGMAGVAQIGSVDCTYQAVFEPLKGNMWTVPVDAGKSGMLQIISKSGNQVYSLKFTGDDIPVWSGETITGQQLPMGIYRFDITYSDGSRFSGNVTIVR